MSEEFKKKQVLARVIRFAQQALPANYLLGIVVYMKNYPLVSFLEAVGLLAAILLLISVVIATMEWISVRKGFNDAYQLIQIINGETNDPDSRIMAFCMVMKARLTACGYYLLMLSGLLLVYAILWCQIDSLTRNSLPLLCVSISTLPLAIHVSIFFDKVKWMFPYIPLWKIYGK